MDDESQIEEIKDEDIQKLKKKMKEAEVIIVGAGAGLSTAAGFYYSGERYIKYFFDFQKKYSIKDMYSGGFYKFPCAEERWAFFSRDIYVNRYMKIPLSTYSDLLSLIKDKNYFVITTNVDHCFQKSGFDKQKLFYTQGDYGLLQCEIPCCQETFDNKQIIEKLVLDQGFTINNEGELIVEDKKKIKMKVSKELIPKCPKCGANMKFNLRGDDRFVEDKGWHQACGRYHMFLEENKNKNVLFFELGIGFNTPAIIKYPFMRYTYNWPNASYCCVNLGEGFAPEEIRDKSIIINNDINKVIEKIKK